MDCYWGYNGMFSAYGNAAYRGPSVPTNLTFDPNNHFANNVHMPRSGRIWLDGFPCPSCRLLQVRY